MFSSTNGGPQAKNIPRDPWATYLMLHNLGTKDGAMNWKL